MDIKVPKDKTHQMGWWREPQSKNLQSFLEISHMQKEVLPSHKMQDHAYE